MRSFDFSTINTTMNSSKTYIKILKTFIAIRPVWATTFILLLGFYRNFFFHASARGTKFGIPFESST